MSLIRSASLSAAGAVCLLLILGPPGCAKQGEGERCDWTNSGHDDCEIGLICWRADDLNDHSTDRCCPEEGSSVSDACLPATPFSGTGGKDGGTGGKDGAADGSDATTDATDGAIDGKSGDGGPCTHNSDCVDPLVCGPKGTCQIECVTDKDCSEGEICDTTSHACQLAASDAGKD